MTTEKIKPAQSTVDDLVRLAFAAEHHGIVDSEDGIPVETVSAGAWLAFVDTVILHATQSAAGGGLCSDGRGTRYTAHATRILSDAMALRAVLAPVAS